MANFHNKWADNKYYNRWKDNRWSAKKWGEKFSGGYLDEAEAARKVAEERGENETKFLDPWPAELDTGRNETYLSNLEKDLIFELNKVRTDPKRYAIEYLIPLKGYFNGIVFHYPDENFTNTWVEGKRALEEAIGQLTYMGDMQGPRSVLEPSIKVFSSAKNHCLWLSRQSTFPMADPHIGENGSKYNERILNEFAGGNARPSYFGECIAINTFTKRVAQKFVIQYIVDDGVSSRIHRVTIFDWDYVKVGPSFSSSAQWKNINVINFTNKIE